MSFRPRWASRLLVLSSVVLAVAAQAQPPVPVSVLYFDNNSGDPANAHLSKGLADMAITNLATLPGLQVVERDKLESLLRELKLQKTSYFDPATAQKLGKGLGAAYVVTGAFQTDSTQIRLDIRIIHIETGRIVKAEQIVGERGRFFELQQQLMARFVAGLEAALGRSILPAASRQQVLKNRANRADTIDTALAYGRGLDLKDRGEYRQASLEMQQLMVRVPDFSPARARYQELEGQIQALRAGRAQAAAARTSREEQHFVARMNQYLTGRPSLMTGGPQQPPSLFGGRAMRREQRRVNREQDLVEEYFGYLIMRGTWLRERVLKLADARPQELLPHLRAYYDHQAALWHELSMYRGLVHSLKEANAFAHDPDFQQDFHYMNALARSRFPGETISIRPDHVEPQALASQLGVFLLLGTQPRLPRKDPFQREAYRCFFRYDPFYAKATLDLTSALSAAERPGRAGGGGANRLEDTESMLDILLTLGMREQALAKLQRILANSPEMDEYVERKSKAIIDGKDNGYPCLPPVAN